MASITFALVAMLAPLQHSTAFSNSVLIITTSKGRVDSPFVLAASNNDDEYEPKEKGFFANFFDELDAFVDDATSRRLGAGAQYYGKRKSSFYGKDDVNRKRDKGVSDPTEDYRGPSAAGYFKWMPDAETGELKPVTRMKERNVERKIR